MGREEDAARAQFHTYEAALRRRLHVGRHERHSRRGALGSQRSPRGANGPSTQISCSGCMPLRMRLLRLLQGRVLQGLSPCSFRGALTRWQASMPASALLRGTEQAFLGSVPTDIFHILPDAGGHWENPSATSASGSVFASDAFVRSFIQKRSSPAHGSSSGSRDSVAFPSGGDRSSMRAIPASRPLRGQRHGFPQPGTPIAPSAASAWENDRVLAFGGEGIQVECKNCCSCVDC